MKKYISFSIVVFLFYAVLTGILFYPRLPTIFTHYAMPDVDTDGGLWYQWYVNSIKDKGFVYDITPFAGYPFGYDIAISPADNLVYSTQLFILRHIIGFSWQNLIFITNVSSLATYPLAAFFAYVLILYLTKNKKGSVLGGLVFGFSFYHVFMGRGQMSINHIELIPLYFLCVYYYLDKKNLLSLLLTGLMFGLLFKTDAYYAFFSMLFTPIIFFASRYNTKPLLHVFWEMIVFHTSVILLCVLLNFNFFISNLYLFDSASRIQSGRNSVPRNELTTILYFFSPFTFNLLGSVAYHLGYLLYGLPLLFGLSGLFIVKQKKIFIAVLLCLLLSICLSMYIPSLYWVSLVYFKFFSMFRGVGRLILVGNLFLGIMVAMTYMNLEEKYLWFKKYSVTFAIVFVLIYMLGSISTDDTWRRKTNFEALAKLYTPIKVNKDIHIIAMYPNVLNFNNLGFPQPYQLLGQTIHEKYFANGADFRDTKSDVYQGEIKDISKESAIPALQTHGVDTILLYNRLLEDSESINKKLTQDSRLTFIGHYVQPGDNGYSSANDKSRDISVYHIHDAKPFTSLHFYLAENGSEIGAKKYANNIYKIAVPKQKHDVQIVFTYPYSSKWGIFNNRYTPFFLNIWQKNLAKNLPSEEYYNSWTIKKEDTGKSFYIMFRPDMNKQLGDIISITTFGILLAIILKHVKNKRH
jgi:hypothetical protein